LLAWLVVALISAGCVGPRKVSDKDIETIDLPGLLALVDRQKNEPDKKRLLLIDPRSELSFQRGHLPGAWNLLLSQVDPELGRDPRIEAYDSIVVYGDNPGSASAKAMVKRLLRMRYKGVRWFPGGLEAWRSGGLPVEGGG
jgi:rhodanese-related sulfurtransferase